MLTIASFYSATDFYISFSFRQPHFALLLDACIMLSSDLASIYNICSSPLHYSLYQMQSKQKKVSADVVHARVTRSAPFVIANRAKYVCI